MDERLALLPRVPVVDELVETFFGVFDEIWAVGADVARRLRGANKTNQNL
jgi:hypothetical protein